MTNKTIAVPSELLDAEGLEALQEWAAEFDQKINVGQVQGDFDEYLESTAGYAARLASKLRALLDDDECCHEFVPFQANCTKCGIPYKAAAQPQGEPVAWLDWNGGDCPVGADTMVEYMLAGNPKKVCGPDAASRLDWHHDHRPAMHKSNIVKYRVYADQPAPVAIIRSCRRVCHCCVSERRDFACEVCDSEQPATVAVAPALPAQKSLFKSPTVLPHPPRHAGFLGQDRETPGYTLEQMKEHGIACAAAAVAQNTPQ